MAGQNITSNGAPVFADSGQLKTFQPTGSQFNDASLFGTPGGTRLGLGNGTTPASAGISPDYYIAPNGPTNQQVNGFADDILQKLGTPNGTVESVAPVAGAVIGGMTGGLATGALGEVFGAAAGTAIKGVTDAAGNGEGVFAGAQLGTYTPTSSVFGQAYDFSCVAASCKMAAGLSDVPESYIRQAIQTDTSGTSLSNIPGGLQQLGFTGTATYAKNATVASIESATEGGASVIANVTTESGGIHAIVVDSVKDGVANIRDPWPLGVGSTYSVPVDALGKALTGSVVIVHP